MDFYNQYNDFCNNNEIKTINLIVSGREYEGYFSELRVKRSETPDGYHRYEVRTKDFSEELSTLEEYVVVNYGGVVFTKEEIPLDKIYNTGKYSCAIIDAYTIIDELNDYDPSDFDFYDPEDYVS